MYSISEFQSQLRGQMAKENLFHAIIPNIINLPSIGDTLSFHCESTEIPGVSIATEERKTMGPVYKMPYGRIFRELPMTFTCSESLIERDFFEKWVNKIITSDFKIAYPAEYETDITIEKLTEHHKISKKWILYNAYPLTVASQAVNWGGTDLLRLNIMISFRSWKSE